MPRSASAISTTSSRSESWKYTAVILCGVGLFKEFIPSSPFLVDYAVEYGNFTSHVVTHEILPVTTYGYLASLFILLFITDFLRYKPIIILGGVTAVATWCITIWFYNDHASLRQIVDSISKSADVAYLTYLYANVDRKHYTQVTSYTHSAMHMGKFLAGSVGQLLLSYKVLTLDKINYLSLAGVFMFLILALLLPKVNRSIYFYPRANSTVSGLSTGLSGGGGGSTNLPTTNSSSPTSLPVPVCSSNESANGSVNPSSPVSSAGNGTAVTVARRMSRMESIKKRNNSIHQRVANYPYRRQTMKALRALWRDFKIAYCNRYVLRWSLWWSIAFAIYLQIGMYVESLWKEIEDETHEHNFNGAIDASHALLSAVFAILLPYIKLPWTKWGEIYLSFISILQGAVILWMSQTHHLYIAYICYIIFQTMFQVVIIIASAEVAESVKEDSEAFIFGINTLMALVIQALLTLTITGEQGFELDIRDEFVVYGIYSSLLGVIFLMIAIQNRNKHWDLHSKPDQNHQNCGIAEHEFSENVCSGAVISVTGEDMKSSVYMTSAPSKQKQERQEGEQKEGVELEYESSSPIPSPPSSRSPNQSPGMQNGNANKSPKEQEHAHYK